MARPHTPPRRPDAAGTARATYAATMRCLSARLPPRLPKSRVPERRRGNGCRMPASYSLAAAVSPVPHEFMKSCRRATFHGLKSGNDATFSEIVLHDHVPVSGVPHGCAKEMCQCENVANAQVQYQIRATTLIIGNIGIGCFPVPRSPFPVHYLLYLSS